MCILRRTACRTRTGRGILSPCPSPCEVDHTRSAGVVRYMPRENLTACHDGVDWSLGIETVTCEGTLGTYRMALPVPPL
jgi:hypothetical protein